MKIEFSGAAGTVTGSSHLFTINNKKVLLDCGMYQGKDVKIRGNDSFTFAPNEIDYLILSHAHIDHSGRIPMLYAQGFNGKIITTPPTKDLSQVMLEDSAKIQEQDAERLNKRIRREGKEEIVPLYTMEDAQNVMKLFTTVDYDKEVEVFEGLKLKFIDSGHMLGSSYVVLTIKEESKEEITVCFSGDVGNHNIPLLKEPGRVDKADILLLESTYGNRVHLPQKNENDKLIQIINTTVANGGNVIIPSFAVGRAQEIIYILNEYAEKGMLDSNVEVYLDSPLANKSTQVFSKYELYLDEEAQKNIRGGDDVLKFEKLFFVEDIEHSKLLNSRKSGAVIISASGMADAGRVRHHLKHNLWRNECSVVFVGYQAEGTLGRLLLDGAKHVTITGENIEVKAKIYQMNGLSGHADRNGLMEFVENFKEKPQKIYLVHGDEQARASLGRTLLDKGYNVSIAQVGDVVSINDRSDIATPADEIEENPMVKKEEQSNEGVLESTDSKLGNEEDIIKILNSDKLKNLSDEQLLRLVKSKLNK